MIQEVIIVEGKDDITRVRQALDCEVIATGGIHISPQRMKEIVEITSRRGAIILTDPDHAGGKIRAMLRRNLTCPVKEAFILRELCTAEGDVGIENASPEEIRQAIERAKPIRTEKTTHFDSAFMFRHGLTGRADSKRRREYVAKKLHMGRPNGKEFLRRLNAFAYEVDEVEKILQELDGRDE
ncbi:MAG: ribonuclease M5 [Tissierellia bacterium]|nr:ribonuclease M5 [Tissierellia bacterium]